MIYTNDYESPLGNILLAGDKQGLTGLWFTEGSRYTGLGLKKDARRCETDYFDQTKEWLDIYFSGRDPGFDLHHRAMPPCGWIDREPDWIRGWNYAEDCPSGTGGQ